MAITAAGSQSAHASVRDCKVNLYKADNHDASDRDHSFSIVDRAHGGAVGYLASRLERFDIGRAPLAFYHAFRSSATHE